ncbi:MAG: hypothetical protein K6G00_05790 [Treponema sp.]|nr:hypothetical protein [Treponema sp.]
MSKDTGFLKRMFSPFFKRNKIKDLGLIGDIQSSIGNFALKTTSLNNSYEAEKAIVSNLVTEANALFPLKNINAVKFEQDILIKLTEVSSACDALLSTGRADEFKKHLTSLETLIRQRKAMTD